MNPFQDIHLKVGEKHQTGDIQSGIRTPVAPSTHSALQGVGRYWYVLLRLPLNPVILAFEAAVSSYGATKRVQVYENASERCWKVKEPLYSVLSAEYSM